MTSPLTELQALGQAFDGGWRDISSAPRDELTVCVLWNGVEVLAASRYESIWVDMCHDMVNPAPTHWMPLPAAPKCCAACGALDFACDCNQIVAAGLAPVGGE